MAGADDVATGAFPSCAKSLSAKSSRESSITRIIRVVDLRHAERRWRRYSGYVHGEVVASVSLVRERRQNDPVRNDLSDTRRRETMAEKKVVFVAFAIEDVRQRDFLKGQSLHARAPFEFVDMSVKEPYDKDWKDRVRTRIRRSQGVIVLVSKNSLTSTGQKWEIQCAKEEKKPLRGIWAYADDRTSLEGVAAYAWSDKNIGDFIDSL